MQASYQPFWVIISIMVAIVSACISLSILDGMNSLAQQQRHLRIVLAGLVFATGVWAMHFIGMLAVILPMPLAYSPLVIVVSFLFSVIGSISAMGLISLRDKSYLHQLSASVLLTAAICLMHYLGMASMRMQPPIIYDKTWVLISIFIAFIASYVGLTITGYWQKEYTKNKFVFIATGIFLGVAVSAMHYSAMEGTYFTQTSISLAVNNQGLMGDKLGYAVLSSTSLIMLLSLFSSLRASKLILWKVLLIVSISELTVMLVLPIILPDGISKIITALFDVGLLLIFIFPVIWQIKVNNEELLIGKILIEQSFEAQQVSNQLLYLPLEQLSMSEFLNQALRIIQQVSWLSMLPQGAIFLNNAREQCLVMRAEFNLANQISQQCAKVKYGQCLCGLAASQREIQYLPHVNALHSIGFDGMEDHGHYNMPLIEGQQLLGVLCLYLKAGQVLSDSEQVLLLSFATTIAELISHKQSMDENRLAKTVFEHNLTGLLVTNAENKILHVNAAFEKITGYTEASVLYQSPSILKSERHDPLFYQQLWTELLETNNWEGEIWNKRKNGQDYPQWSRITVIRDEQGKIENFMASFEDISQWKASEERIYQLAYYDALTGLPNRSLFYDRLDQALLFADRNKTKVALMFIDLDEFKVVNDTFGHEAGDTVLQGVAKRAALCLRASDTLARLGGDEFVVILRNLQGEQVADIVQRIVEKILEQLCQSHEYQGNLLSGGASIGIVIYPDNANNRQNLIRQADIAMYEAKIAGRNTYRFFSNEMSEKILQRNKMENALSAAIDNGELSIVYQPLLDANTLQVIGAESLLRWNSKEMGFISPLDFIPLAEETGLIGGIGEWVVEQVCGQFKQWEMDAQVNNLQYIAVNVSIHQLIDKGFSHMMQRVCHKIGIETQHIELEITEGGLAQYPETIMQVLHELRSLGFKLAIDDFGTDYSSLSRLKAFNVDLLKIDRSFICDMTTDSDNAAIVQAVIDLSEALSLITLAEGVETVEQLELLRQYGCSRFQGYYFGKPIQPELFAEQWLNCSTH